MKKFMLILAVAAFTCSPLFGTQAQAGQGKNKIHKIVKHHKAHHHAAKHHRKHHKA